MAVALRDDCWDDGLSYHVCCEFPPGHPDFRAFCWNDYFLFEDCCYAHGPAVHVLPAVWDERLELVFPGLDPVVIMQDPQNGTILQKWNNPVEGGTMCALWDDNAARLLAAWAPRGLRVLDAGAGVGLTAIVASLLGNEAVAVDVGESSLRHAEYNAAINEAAVTIGPFNICEGPQAFLERFGEEKFDIVVASELIYVPEAPPLGIGLDCIFELVDAIGAPGVQVLLNDFTQPLEEWEVTHAGQWKDRFRRIGFVPFAAFGASPEKAQEMRVEVWKRTRDLDLAWVVPLGRPRLGGWVVPALR